MNVINVCPHPLTLQTRDGLKYEVMPCTEGSMAVKPQYYRRVKEHESGAAVIRVEYSLTFQAEQLLDALEAKYPNSIIVGSVLAAKAAPGRVYGMVHAEGHSTRDIKEAACLGVKRGKCKRDYVFVTFEENGDWIPIRDTDFINL